MEKLGRFFRLLKFPTTEVIELLKRNVIGTPGRGMLYQHLGVENKIYNVLDPFYVNLIRGTKILATCCFCYRDTLNSGQHFSSFYIRYFTFDKIFRSKVKNYSRRIRDSSLRQEIHDLLKGQGLNKKLNDIFFHYAYLDPKNIRSAALCEEFGFICVRNFSTIIFNRINPNENKLVDLISDSEIETVKKTLKAFYKEYSMFSFENLFGQRKYYVIRDNNNNILAGVQANPESWRILELPGLTGKLILSTFSYLPILKKIFNKDYNFLTLEGIFYTKGNEASLQILFETLLAKYKKNSAMMWVDKNSHLYTVIKSLNLGLVDKLNKEVEANVICKFLNFTDFEINVFRDKPAYISGIDLT